MPGLWRFTEGKEKYLVQRRDATVPEWPWFVLGASDPAAPAALREYARQAAIFNMGVAYVQDIMALADQFEVWGITHESGDPSAPRHRADDTAVVAALEAAGRG